MASTKTSEGSVNPREEASVDGSTDESEGEEEKELFTVDEHLLLGFLSLHGDKNCRLTPVPHKVQGFTKEEMSDIIGNAHSGQYCVAFYHDDQIQLLHSVFMKDTTVYACSTRGTIDESLVAFNLDKLVNPMEGLSSPDSFKGGETTSGQQKDRGKRVPTSTDLINFEVKDIENFVSEHKIIDIPPSAARKVPTPASMILIHSCFYSLLVKGAGAAGDIYGWTLSALDALEQVQEAARATPLGSQLDPLIYYLLATSQRLNTKEDLVTEVDPKFVSANLQTQLMKLKMKYFRFIASSLPSDEVPVIADAVTVLVAETDPVAKTDPDPVAETDPDPIAETQPVVTTPEVLPPLPKKKKQKTRFVSGIGGGNSLGGLSWGSISASRGGTA